jgi:hypothetical protein
MIGRSGHRAAITETPKAAFRHLSEMKSQVILKLFGSTCDAFVTKVKRAEVWFWRYSDSEIAPCGHQSRDNGKHDANHDDAKHG